MAHSVLHYQRMRLCLVTVLGFSLAGCGLSMNPDLPSTKEENAPPFGGDSEGPTEGIDDPLDGGQGAAPIVAPPAGSGGAPPVCIGLGGDGGASSCEEGS